MSFHWGGGFLPGQHWIAFSFCSSGFPIDFSIRYKMCFLHSKLQLADSQTRLYFFFTENCLVPFQHFVNRIHYKDLKNECYALALVIYLRKWSKRCKFNSQPKYFLRSQLTDVNLLKFSFAYCWIFKISSNFCLSVSQVWKRHSCAGWTKESAN